MNIVNSWIRLLPICLVGVIAATSSATADSEGSAGPPAATLSPTAVDDLGDTLTLERVPQRIVSLAPSNTEFLFALGLGDRVVGVTEYCNYPDAARTVERVAGFSTLSAEKIASVEPDLVLAARGNDLEGLEMVRKMGISVFAIDVQSVDQLVEAVRRIGRITGADVAAGELADSLHLRIVTVRQAISESKAVRPKVFWGFWGEPIYTAGEGTIIDDVIHRAGGDNVGRSAPGSWPQIGLEALVALAPEVIITTSSPGGVDAMAGQIDRLRSFEGWKSLPAVKSGRVHFVEGDLLTRPGPRLIEALEQLALLFQQGSGPSAE